MQAQNSSDTELSTPIAGKIEYLAAEDIRVAASLLYQAYKDDPVFRQIFNADKEGYEKRLRAAIREELNVFWQSGQPMFGMYNGDTLEGVVCITQPDQSFGPGRYWHWRLKMLLTAGYVSTRQMVEKERQITESVPYKEYLLLVFIAVHPRYQHKGLGHLLISAAQTLLTEKPQAEGVVALATRPEYQSFLAHQGFTPLHVIKVGQIEGQLMALDRDSDNSQSRGEVDAI